MTIPPDAVFEDEFGFYDPEFAYCYDTSDSAGAGRTQKKGAAKGDALAKSHYPYAVIDDVQELRALAESLCIQWWSKLKGNENHKDSLPEVKRVYVTSFARKYMEHLESLKPPSESQAGRSHQQEVEVKIKDERRLTDGVLYTVDFFDPVRMTRSVSFGVSVKDDGVVELEESNG